MRHFQSSNKDFLAVCASWLQDFKEVLVASSFGAGDRDYLFCTSLADLNHFCESTAEGYRSASVAAFRTRQLGLRGIVDQAFIDLVAAQLPESPEYLVLRLTPNSKTGLLAGNACASLSEVLHELQDELGRPVAVGKNPEWDPFSTLPPEETGCICTTISEA
jgi:hypothetical protein